MLRFTGFTSGLFVPAVLAIALIGCSNADPTPVSSSTTEGVPYTSAADSTAPSSAPATTERGNELPMPQSSSVPATNASVPDDVVPQFNFAAVISDTALSGELDVAAACESDAYTSSDTVLPGVVVLSNPEFPAETLTARFNTVVSADADNAVVAFVCTHIYQDEETWVVMARYGHDGHAPVLAETVRLLDTAPTIPWWVAGGSEPASWPFCTTAELVVRTVTASIVEIVHTENCEPASMLSGFGEPVDSVAHTRYDLTVAPLKLGQHLVAATYTKGADGVAVAELLAAADIMEIALLDPAALYGPERSLDGVAEGLYESVWFVYMAGESAVLQELEDNYFEETVFYPSVVVAPDGTTSPGSHEPLPPSVYSLQMRAGQSPDDVPYRWELAANY